MPMLGCYCWKVTARPRQGSLHVNTKYFKHTLVTGAGPAGTPSLKRQLVVLREEPQGFHRGH